MSTTQKWPFDQPRSCAVLTVRQILDGSQPVLHVTHDTQETSKIEDAKIVAFEEMIALDASLLQLADLSPGWQAWRQSVGAPWIRESKSR